MAALVLGVLTSQPGTVAQSAEPSASDLFYAYRLRRFDEFAAKLGGVKDVGALRKQVEREGRDWPTETKAAFLLELADAALQSSARKFRTGPEVGLFEDACQTVRRLSPQGQFETAWHAAAISVLSARYATMIPVEDHLKHVRGRFDEGHLALIRAMPRERMAWAEAIQIQPSLEGPAQTEMWFALRSRTGRAGMRDTVKLFEAARAHESVRAEATVRQAAILAIWEEHKEALPLLEGVPRMTDDPWLRYMAAILSGRSLEATGRYADADAAYRSAASVQSNGKAARLAHAAMLFAAGRREEADQLVTEALSERAGPADPWKEFFSGDFRFLEGRRTAMRDLLK